MTSNDTSMLMQRNSAFSRVVAFALLLLISIGAVAAAAHNHGTVTPQNQVFASDSAAGESGDSRSSSKKRSNGSECLVCQLHQHLNNGLLGASPHVSPPVELHAGAIQDHHSFDSQTFTPQRGRAPPTISLA